MDVSEAKRLKTLEDENTKLKRLLADAMLDNAALKVSDVLITRCLDNSMAIVGRCGSAYGH